MCTPNKTVKVRLVFRDDEVDLICAYFPAREAYTVENWGHTRHYGAIEEHWTVINGLWDIDFFEKNKYRIVEYPDRVREYQKYAEFDMDIYQGSDPFWYDWRGFCEQAQKFYEKISSRRYLSYKEKFA